MQDNNNAMDNKRVLVISGGGARGAWGGGLIKMIYEKEHPDYRCIAGNSTGSLLAPLVAINDYELMERSFTEISMDDIFDVNPFDEDGEIVFSRAILKIVEGKENLGETNNLRCTIQRLFTEDKYQALKDTGRTIIATVVSLTSNEIQFSSSDLFSYHDMMDWIWASANQPIFMTAVDKNGHKWVDGGIKENVPIMAGLKYAADNGIKVIDVVVNNLREGNTKKWPNEDGKTNVVPKLLRIIDIFSEEVRLSDIEVGLREAKLENVEIYLYYMKLEEFNLCPKSLLFKNDVLRKLWDLGYHHTSDKLLADKPIILPGNNKIYLK